LPKGTWAKGKLTNGAELSATGAQKKDVATESEENIMSEEGGSTKKAIRSRGAGNRETMKHTRKGQKRRSHGE